jgi:cytochrome c-type biogenesis protein CcmH
MKIISAVLALILFAGAAPIGKAWAVDPRERLADSALETRARAISAELRCVVCQNQSIDDSDAELAKDLRNVIRTRIVAGDSDQEAIDFVVARYGEFVLLRPPFKGATIILWLGPLLFALFGLIGIILYYKRHPSR